MYAVGVMTSELGLRERTRRAVQADLFAVAIDLFLEQGFEPTTVEQIAQAAGMSRRSFFRYFATKDEVLAHALSAVGAEIAAHVGSRPADEPAWDCLCQGFLRLVEQMNADPRSLPLTRMMLTSPALHASHQSKHISWQTAIAGALNARLDPRLTEDDRQVQAQALAGAALACLTAAQATWVSTDGRRPLDELLRLAMSAVHD